MCRSRCAAWRRLVVRLSPLAIILLTSARPAGATPPTPRLSVPNCTFEPPSGVAGCAPFDAITGQSVPSQLGVDYWLLQRDLTDGEGWRSSLPPGGKVIAAHHQNAYLVRVPDSTAPQLATVPGHRWNGEYLPSYKIAATLAVVVDEGDISGLLDADGLLRLRAVFQRFEEPSGYAGPLLALLPAGVEDVAVVAPVTEGLEAAPRYWDIRVPPGASAHAAISVLARCEAVRYIERWDFAEMATNDAVWGTQTGISRANPAGYDLSAKLFARGVTGRGQTLGMLDRGFLPYGSGVCGFRYGPNDSDAMPMPSSLGTGPFWTPGASELFYTPTRKVVAHYLLSPLPGDPDTCLPYPQATQYPTHGGEYTTPPALGDNYVVLAARAGIELDDPTDDEETSDPQATRSASCTSGSWWPPPGYDCARDIDTHFVDHHQDGDGLAPGAQLLIQDFNPPNPEERIPSSPFYECRFAFEDVLA